MGSYFKYRGSGGQGSQIFCIGYGCELADFDSFWGASTWIRKGILAYDPQSSFTVCLDTHEIPHSYSYFCLKSSHFPYRKGELEPSTHRTFY